MGGGIGFRFLRPVTHFLAKKGLKLAKNVLKRAGPKILKTAIATGADVTSGKNMKTTVKRGLRRGIGNIASSSRDVLLDEVNIPNMMLAKKNAENKKEGSLELMGFDEEVVAFDELADNDENFDWENISGGTTEPDAKAHSALLRRYKRSCQSKNIYLITLIFSSIFDQEK